MVIREDNDNQSSFYFIFLVKPHVSLVYFILDKLVSIIQFLHFLIPLESYLNFLKNVNA